MTENSPILPVQARPTSWPVVDSRRGLADQTGQYFVVAGSNPARRKSVAQWIERMGTPGQKNEESMRGGGASRRPTTLADR